MTDVNHETIVLRTYSSTPDFYGECECAVLEVTARLVEVVRRRIEVAVSACRDDPTLWELCFGSPDPEFYDYALVEACVDADATFEAGFEHEGKARLPDHVSTADFDAARTECEEMVLRIVSGSTQAVRDVLKAGGFEFDSDKREFAKAGVPVHLVTIEQLKRPPGAFVEIEGIRTVDLASLIEMKLRSGTSDLLRAQDVADVIGLIRRHKLTTTFARGIDKRLRPEFRKLVKAVHRES